MGDQLRFRIESLETPFGDMFVSTQKMHSDIRRDLVWEELKMAFNKGQFITGRILNPTSGGYIIYNVTIITHIIYINILIDMLLE